jgi:hypothetical protein
MHPDREKFLNLKTLPVRLSVDEVAWLLNCQPHDISILMASRLLKPLGNPPPNGIKYFATALVLESTKDPAWLTKATNAIHNHWRTKNGRKIATLAPVTTGSIP